MMKELGFAIDEIYCGPQKRAIHSATIVQAAFSPDKAMKTEILLNGYEKGGVYYKDKTFPGLTAKEMREICPHIQFPEDYAIPEDKGWFSGATKVEDDEGLYERVKGLI